MSTGPPPQITPVYPRTPQASWSSQTPNSRKRQWADKKPAPCGPLLTYLSKNVGFSRRTRPQWSYPPSTSQRSSALPLTIVWNADTMLLELNLVSRCIQHVHLLLPSIAGREYCKSMHTWPTHPLHHQQHEEHFRLTALRTDGFSNILCAKLHAATCTLGPSLPRGKPAAMPKDSDTNFTTNTLGKWKLLLHADHDTRRSWATSATLNHTYTKKLTFDQLGVFPGKEICYKQSKIAMPPAPWRQKTPSHYIPVAEAKPTKPPGELNNSKWSSRTTSPESEKGWRLWGKLGSGKSWKG